MTIYIEEFLYRGRPEGSERPPAWHVVLGHPREDGSIRLQGPLNMTQAAEAGATLPDILEAIQPLAELEALRDWRDRVVGRTDEMNEAADAEAFQQKFGDLLTEVTKPIAFQAPDLDSDKSGGGATTLASEFTAEERTSLLGRFVAWVTTP